MSQESRRHGDDYGSMMKHSGTRLLYGYWDELRGDRLAPERREVEPADIGPLLSDTFILEAGDDGGYAYRLAGTRVCSTFGRELKGEDWLAGWADRDREALSTLLRSIVKDAAGAVVGFDGRNARGNAVPLETILLPLVNHGNGYRRILGSMLALDVPYWLGAQPVVDRSISALHLIWPEQLNASGRAFSVRGGEIIERVLPLRRLQHLSLYEGGRVD